MLAHRFSTLAATALVLVSSAAAQADGKFQVDPTRVDLAPDAPTAAILVSNEGAEPLRLQLTAVRWRDDVDGGIQLEPAPDVIVRPALVEIPAGQKRPIRVGLAAPSGALEGSFRVFVEELPDRRPANGGRIQVLTRVGIPVFVAPRRTTTDLRVTVAAVTGGAATVMVEATGTVHVKVATVTVTAVSGEGAVAWSHEETGWYVLAGALRRFGVGLGRDVCRAGDRITAEVVSEDGATWTSPPARCEP